MSRWPPARRRTGCWAGGSNACSTTAVWIPLNGYFVDQRWFDLAPGLVSDRAIVRDPQYNIAYWNLHSRLLEHDGTSYTVNGEPLAFFHFSGFDPQQPDVLSRHQSRVVLSGDSALVRICGEYAKEVIAAGYAGNQGLAVHLSHASIGSGVQLSPAQALRDRRSSVARCQGSPFTQDGCESFMSWLASLAPAAPPGVNRLLAELYGTRQDLQEAFPDVAGADHPAFLRWAKEYGPIDEPALALLDAEASDPPAEPSAPPVAVADDSAPRGRRSPARSRGA